MAIAGSAFIKSYWSRLSLWILI